jgi:hypothetical protein
MATTRLTLAAALAAVGVAQVFVGNPFIVGGMEALAATEGDITTDMPFDVNALTAVEYTGGAEHQATITQGAVTVTVPVINGQADVYDKISPVGDGSGGGWSAPQKVVETTVLVMPLSEMAADGSFSRTAAGLWTPATPKHCIWLWRAYAVPSGDTFGSDNGGKRMNSVTFRTMYRGENPEGHKMWTRGDPPATITSTGLVSGTKVTI